MNKGRESWILGSIRVRKEHPVVQSDGIDGAIAVMLYHGVPIQYWERFRDIIWAYEYQVVPAAWVEDWHTETFDDGLVYKLWTTRQTSDAKPDATAADARAALETLRKLRHNPARNHTASRSRSKPRTPK